MALLPGKHRFGQGLDGVGSDALGHGDAMGEIEGSEGRTTGWLQTDLSELDCPDFSKPILPALVFRPGFTTLHCAFSPI